MSSLRSLYQLEGIIINSQDHGEYDRSISFLTKDQGIKRAIAKGVKKIHSRRGPHLDLLNKVSLLLHQGKLLTITQVSTIESFADIKEDLARLSWAIMLCEFTIKILPYGHPEPKYSDLFVQTLEKIANNKRSPAGSTTRSIVQQFSLEALRILGFMSDRKQRSLKEKRADILEIISLLPNSNDLRDIFQRIH